MNKFFLVFNGNDPNGMTKHIWEDVDESATLRYESDTLKNNILKKIKKLHFSSRINRCVWLPFKKIWDCCLSIRLDELDPQDRNYIIFTSAIKFSPSYILKLKNRNACIVFYLMDTVEMLHIAKNAKEFHDYLNKYHVDLCYSFDPGDCSNYGITFFDVYSCEKLREYNTTGIIPRTDLFYVGNCRSQDRLDAIHRIFELSSGKLHTDLYLAGVASGNLKYPENIHYNKPLQYTIAIEHSKNSKCILELVNGNQTGNTLRLKEAVCFNLKLLTNNSYVLKSQFYNADYIQVFDEPEKIDFDWINRPIEVNYAYNGEFSPKQFFRIIVAADKGKRGI